MALTAKSWSHGHWRRWSIPTDYSKRYRGELENAKNVRVLLHANAIHLQMNAVGKKIEHVTAACVPNHKFLVKARDTVIACGALENARLLLAARDVVPCGIGNRHDLVGRYYQSHRFGVCGHAELKDPSGTSSMISRKTRRVLIAGDGSGSLSGAQKKHRIGNVVGFFFRTVSGASEHRNAMVSMIMLAKTFLGGAKRPKRFFQILGDQRRELSDHLWIVIKDGPSVFGQLTAVAYTRFFQKRRLPMILPSRKSNRFPLFFQTEHAPLRDSRVLLDESSVDDFGMPRLEARIRFSEIDFRTVSTFVLVFKTAGGIRTRNFPPLHSGPGVPRKSRPGELQQQLAQYRNHSNGRCS